MQQDDRIFVVVGACIVFAVALVAALMWLNSGITVDAPKRATVVVPQTVPTPETSVVPASKVVEAKLSDEGDEGLFRDAVARLSTHPALASYLVHDRLLRRFVLAVDAVAGGYSPADEVGFLQPARPFIVREDDEGRLVGEGAPGDLRIKGQGGQVIVVEGRGDRTAMTEALQAVAGVRGLIEVAQLQDDGQAPLLRIRLEADPAPEVSEAVFATMAEGGFRLRELRREAGPRGWRLPWRSRQAS